MIDFSEESIMRVLMAFIREDLGIEDAFFEDWMDRLGIEIRDPRKHDSYHEWSTITITLLDCEVCISSLVIPTNEDRRNGKCWRCADLNLADPNFFDSFAADLTARYERHLEQREWMGWHLDSDDSWK